MIISNFDPTVNYIGSSDWQKQFTKWIAIDYPEINFTAYKHDSHYLLMLAERTQVLRFIMKLCYDLVFLILGIFRCLFKGHLLGIPIVINLTIILICSSFWYLYINRNRKVNLSK